MSILTTERQGAAGLLFLRLVRNRGVTLITELELPICRRIVEAHKGTVAVESQVDQGSTFTVCLPVERATE